MTLEDGREPRATDTELASILLSVTITLGSARCLLRHDPDRAAERLQWAIDTIDDVVHKLRRPSPSAQDTRDDVSLGCRRKPSPRVTRPR